MGNGRQNHKFSSPKNQGGRYTLLYCAGADGNTCGRKSRGDEKQLIWSGLMEILLFLLGVVSCCSYSGLY